MRSRRRCALLGAILVTVIGALSQPAPAGSSADCGPGDRLEPALQGQIPITDRLSGSAAPGYWCNLELVGSFASRSFANFDTYKNCAYYTDNVGFVPGSEGGGVVLDVSDPRNPVKTAYLTARAMGNGGETLRVNQARGLLVVAYYNALMPVEELARRWIAVYSVAEDCAHPKLLADAEMPSAVGHEACFQPDGMVYYMAGGFTITPIDLTDPAAPKQLSDPWPLKVHGCSISDDGRRGYFASVINGFMTIVDTSQAQDRVPGAQPRVLATFPTPDAQVQQATVPLWYDGHPYVLLWSEGRMPAKVCVPGLTNFGYPRFIDVADDTHPVEIAKIQTEVMLPENCPQVMGDATFQTSGVERGDPGYLLVSTFILGYDSHMCTPDRLQDPTILACAQLGSGLRVYDIRDPKAPAEIAYYNSGTVSPTDPTVDWAFARPVIRRDLGQIWWVTHLEGFRVAKFRDGVWPFPDSDPCPSGYDYFQDQYDLGYRACQAHDAEQAAPTTRSEHWR
jgi:hypothetical protein